MKTHKNPSWSKNEPDYVETIEVESAHVDPEAFIAKGAVFAWVCYLTWWVTRG